METPFCCVRIAFPNALNARKFIEVLIRNKLFAAADLTESCCYTFSKNTDSYEYDENLLGIESADRQVDVLLDIYTNIRMSSGIENLLGEESDEFYDYYLIYPLHKISAKLINSIGALNIYHMK